MADKRFGGFWRRLWAFCIDKVLLYLLSLILYLIGLLALQIAGVPSSVLSGLRGGMGPFMVLYTCATLFTAMLYFTGFHGTFGRTPGKMLLGLKVIQVSGDRMTLGVAFLRWVGTLLSGSAFGLGYLWIAFDGRKQGWHDKIAATLVIRTGNTHVAAAPPDPAMGSPILTASAPDAPMAAPDATPIPSPADDEATSGLPAPAPPPEGNPSEEPRGAGAPPFALTSASDTPEKGLDKGGHIL